MSTPQPPQRQLRVTTYVNDNNNQQTIVEIIMKAHQLQLAEAHNTKKKDNQSKWLQFYRYLINNGPLRGYSNVHKKNDRENIKFAKKFLIDVTTHINNNIPARTQDANLSITQSVAKEWLENYNSIKEREEEAANEQRHQQQQMQRTLNERERNMGFNNYETASEQLRSLRRAVGNTAIRRATTITPGSADQPNQRRRFNNNGVRGINLNVAVPVNDNEDNVNNDNNDNDDVDVIEVNEEVVQFVQPQEDPNVPT